MRTMRVMLFIVLGVAGFGGGGVISAGTLLIPLGGGVGGALLGLALRDWRKVAILALLGSLGLTFGVFATLALAAFLSYSAAPMGMVLGAVVGASLGVAFLNWRKIVILTVAGGLGFGFGLFVGDSLPGRLESIISIAITGAFGGALLGAALGYLENRTLAEEQGLRVL